MSYKTIGSVALMLGFCLFTFALFEADWRLGCIWLSIVIMLYGLSALKLHWEGDE